MIKLVEEIIISENKKNLLISDIKVKGGSLIEKARNKSLAMKYLKSKRTFKVVGKENQIQAYLSLEKFGVKLKFPQHHQRQILISKLLQ